MPNVFDINLIALALPGYNLSWLELLGTLTGLVCVALAARGSVLNWFFGIANALFFLALFYQINLYADMLLQAYFLVTSVLGWWRWTHAGKDSAAGIKQRPVTRLTGRQRGLLLAAIAAATAGLTALIVQLHPWFPALFPAPAAYPAVDALIAVLSVTAQILLVQKKLETWVLWIVVDVLSVGLYTVKGVWLVAGEYVVFGLLASLGLWQWRRLLRSPAREAA